MLSAYEEIARDHISTALYVDELRAHKRRTGINARHLLKQAKDIPEGLTAREIDRWIKPRPTAARRDHLDFVLDLWRRQPDRTDDLIPVTPEMVAEIKAHRRRTGVSFYAIIYNGTEPPEGLHPATLYQVVGGTQRSIRKKHYEYMIAAYENYRRPDIRHSAETIAPLRAEQERTGLSISRLVRLQNKTPEGFSATRMQRFFNGYQKTVPKEHYNYLLSCYAAQPEKNK
ncbi:MAG: hypothetical protein CMM50_06115 [Rhodospirillaceae bacterium]|nr:hypothetical protein [Rhodospirillaceae bacterium]